MVLVENLGRGTLSSYVGPNITGTWSTTGYSRDSMIAEGAVSHEYTGRKSSDGQNHVAGILTLDASLSSSIYGKANTVRPSSLRAAVCIKT